MSGPPELGVICKNCGSEVSPYVTECPYCGQRLRKRAPKIPKLGDYIEPPESRRPKLPRLGGGFSLPGGASWATGVAIVAPAVAVLVDRALTGTTVLDLGAISVPVRSDVWRYFAAPFVYSDLGYLFVAAVGVAVFASALERRLGHLATLLLLVACGALGMLTADGLAAALASAGETATIHAAGGNGVALGALAAWFMIHLREHRGSPYEDRDLIGVAVFATVLVALPAVDSWANVWAGLAGGLVGGVAGLAAIAFGRTES